MHSTIDFIAKEYNEKQSLRLPYRIDELSSVTNKSLENLEYKINNIEIKIKELSS